MNTFRESDTSTFGKPREITKANGDKVNISYEDWSQKGSVSMSLKNSLDDDYNNIIKVLPDILHLEGKTDLFQYDHELQYATNNLDKSFLWNVSYGTLLKIKKFLNESSL